MFRLISDINMSEQILIACRLCLCTDPKKSYFSLESPEKFLRLKNTFGLEVDFREMDIYPNHVCEVCEELIEKYHILKDTSLTNETFITKCQEAIKRIGLIEAKKAFTNKSDAQRMVSPEEDRARTSPHVQESGTSHNHLVGQKDEKIEDFAFKEEYKEDDNLTDNEDVPNMDDIYETIGNDSDGDEDLKEEDEDDDDGDEDYGKKKSPSKAYTLKKRVEARLAHYNKPGTCVLCQTDYTSLFEHEEEFHNHVDSMKCPICSQVFMRNKNNKLKSTVKQHIKVVHGTKSDLQPCTICGKLFANPYHHMRTVHSTERLECTYPDCKKFYKTKALLRGHINKKHLGITSVCAKCGDTVKNMSDHRSKCSPTDKNLADRTCSICNKIFSTKNALKLHKTSRHGPGVPEEPCPFCGKGVKFLDIHIKQQHSDAARQPSIPCSFEGCDRMFKTKQNEKVHYRVAHTGERQQCNQCGEWLKNLDGHMRRTHKTGKPLPCPDCGKVFYNSFDLRTHKDRIHEGIKYVCPECGDTSSRIKDHLKSKHGITDVDMANIAIIKTNQYGKQPVVVTRL
jgi:hypothetical protein